MLSAQEAAKLTKREQKVREAKIKRAKKPIEKALKQLMNCFEREMINNAIDHDHFSDCRTADCYDPN